MSPDELELARAEALLDVGRAEDARERLGRIVAASPEDPRGLVMLARSLILTADRKRR